MTSYRGAVNGSAVANTDDALTVGPPSPAAQVGDLLLAVVAGAVNQGPTYYPPAGWQAIPGLVDYDAGTPGVSLAVFHKRATSTDLGDTTFGWDPPHGAVVTVTAYAPSAAGREVRPVESSGDPATTSSATRTTPTITTAGTRWLVAAYADRSGSTWTVPAGQTQRHAVSRGTGAVSLLVTDSAGDVPAGSYSRSVTASASSGTRVETIVALEDAPAAPVVTVPTARALDPFEAVTLPASATAGIPTWSQVSGPTAQLVDDGQGNAWVLGPATMDGGDVVLRAAATAGGQTGTATVTLTVPPHTVWAARGGAWAPVQVLLPGQVPYPPPPTPGAPPAAATAYPGESFYPSETTFPEA